MSNKTVNLPDADANDKVLKRLSKQEVMERRAWRNKIIATLPDPNAAAQGQKDPDARIEAIREQAEKNDRAIAEHMAKFGK